MTAQDQKRFAVTIVHGEHTSLYHVVDRQAPEPQQPCIIGTYRNHEEAYRRASGLNIAEERRNA